MCQQYEAERRFIVDCEYRASLAGYEAAQRGEPLESNPHIGHPWDKYEQEAWDHGWCCWDTGIVPWGVERRIRIFQEHTPIAPGHYAEPTLGYFALNFSNRVQQLGFPQMCCIIDVQEELGADQCPHVVRGICRRIRVERMPTLCLEWPGAGPTVPLIREALPAADFRQKEGDGGEQLFEFYRQHSAPEAVEIMGMNSNVCVFNLVAEFLKCCQKYAIEPPQLHFRIECLGDNNWSTNQREGWDHFRLIMSDYCKEQGNPSDTRYLLNA